MTDWLQVVNDHFAIAFDSNNWVLIVHPAPSAEQRNRAQEKLGFEFPNEFCSLYASLNGFSIKARKSDDQFSFLKPLEELPEFADSVRSWFRESHPDAASQFIPFIDLANGDAIGYLNRDGADEMLFRFDHDALRFEADQAVEDFLYPIGANSIRSLLPGK